MERQDWPGEAPCSARAVSQSGRWHSCGLRASQTLGSCVRLPLPLAPLRVWTLVASPPSVPSILSVTYPGSFMLLFPTPTSLHSSSAPRLSPWFVFSFPITLASFVFLPCTSGPRLTGRKGVNVGLIFVRCIPCTESSEALENLGKHL